MKTVFSLVEAFNKSVVGVPDRKPGSIEDAEEVGFLVGSLQEEIEEFTEALGQDFIGEIDALLDLIYFACGGLCRMGIPSDVSEKMFAAVHDANMMKAKGRKESREHGTCDLDAVKPEDWVSPEARIMTILSDYSAKLAVVDEEFEE